MCAALEAMIVTLCSPSTVKCYAMLPPAWRKTGPGGELRFLAYMAEPLILQFQPHSFRQPPAHTRARPRGPEQEARLSHPTMFSSSFVLSLLLLGLASAYELEDTFLEEYDEASDPRLFFSNFTSGLPQGQMFIKTSILTTQAWLQSTQPC